MDTYSNKEKYYIILTLHIHISGKCVKSAFMKKVCVQDLAVGGIHRVNTRLFNDGGKDGFHGDIND